MLILSALVAGLPVFAQQSQGQDSLVVLLSARSAQVVDVEGNAYRKVVGPARFFHNNTYMLCDTALWSMDSNIINAWGNVSILQEETVLTSEKLTYLIDEDLAQFRGTVVQLTDKDHNTLRTRHLDYNTKDSVAVFEHGGSMRDKDGQIIESLTGTYDSKIKLFRFQNNVNMFTDSIFVKTQQLDYESDKNLATFKSSTDAWKDENMLSSNRGWYDRGQELFFFADNVHVMTEDQEGWCDSLFFHRSSMEVEMLGNAQVTDTTRNVFGLAGRINYVDTLSRVTMTRKPAVISQTEEADGSVDTVYLGAEKLVYHTMRMCDIDSLTIVSAEERLLSLDVDPVGEFRKKAAEEAAKAAEEAAMNDPAMRAKIEAEKTRAARENAARQTPDTDSSSVSRSPADSIAVSDTLSLALADTLQLSDSLYVADSLAVADSIAVTDSIAVVEPPKDTTRIGFLEALKNVRIYKKNMQVACDSLVYCDLDSLARLFKNPLVWQEATRQYGADSISVVIRGGSMEKANLMSNAFITIQEDTAHYDQIKGTEMIGYFDPHGELYRFDVLGGASALFFLEENGELATVNKTESKMLSATFKDGSIQRIYYYEQPKNDGYPVVQLASEERKLKGFSWQPELRPEDRNDVTPLSLRPSERKRYSARPRARFRHTDIYFPGYIDDIHRQIEVRDSLRKVREHNAETERRQAAVQRHLDSLALADSLAFADSLFIADSLAAADSIKTALADSLAAADSLKVVSDSLAVQDSLDMKALLTPEELKAAQKAEKERLKAQAKAEREARKKKRREAKEARWAELDKRDADKAAAKEAKRMEKERRRKRRALEKAAKEAEREARILEEYIEKYRNQQSPASARR